MRVLFSIFVVALTLQASTINIAVAANVSYVIQDLKKEFKKEYPDAKLRITLGSSGKLTAQIVNGAPYHLFMSANMAYPKALYDKKIAITKPVVYAYGGLVYFSKKKRDFSSGITILQDPSIKKIAIANPKTAPYGKAALEVLNTSGVYSGVKSKLVYAESASQTLSYAVKATDLGFVAKSALYSSRMKRYKQGVHWSEVDSKLYTPIEQGIVILKKATGNKEVKQLYDFILGEKAKQILETYGYLVQ